MINKLCIFFALCLLVSCSKDKEGGPDGADLMINATAYIGDTKGLYDIAFYPFKREDGLNNPISDDVQWIANFFNTYEGPMAKNVEQYKEYLPRGQYYIIIRIVADPTGDMKGKFTTKLVDITSKPSMDNVMQFTRGIEGWYQEWEDYYD